MPIAIAGMHRSGTSMITRLLNLGGLDLGPADQLLPAAPDNPEGFWECIPFYRVNEELLGRLGGTWHAPPEPPPGWEAAEGLGDLRARAGALPEALGLREPWGWKDPRNSVTLAFWQSVWPGLKVVVCVRHPLEVANSLWARDRMPLGRALRLWLRYHRDLLDIVPAQRRVVTHYETYFDDPAAELTRVLGALGLPADGADVRAAGTAVVPGLRRGRIDSPSLEGLRLPEGVAEMYRRLLDEGPAPAGASRPLPAIMANALQQALELEGRAALADWPWERERRIRELEDEVRGLRRELNESLARLGLAESGLDEARVYGQDREYWVQLLQGRLAARRYRYADAIAEAVQRVARLGKSREPDNDIPEYPPPWGGSPEPAPQFIPRPASAPA